MTGLEDYQGPATHLPAGPNPEGFGGFGDSDRARRMHSRIMARRCPLEGCAKPLDTSAPVPWHAQCKSGHIFRKEDLYYLRHLEPVA